MKSAKTEINQDIAEPVEIKTFPVSLDEFCQQFSAQERRVALLGAFHFTMKKQKRLMDTAENYQSEFEKFINEPAA